MIIKINGGDVFEGTLQQFKGNFFSNATPEMIKSWCKDNDLTCEITEEANEKITGCTFGCCMGQGCPVNG